MTKKWHEPICKCAMIRKNDDEGCPFGLRIPFGCKRAGDAVDRMAPLTILGDEASDEEKQVLGQANKRMLNWTILGKTTEEPGQCKYAAKIFPDKAAAECNYEDTAPGVGQKSALLAAPFYSQVFSGVGLNGLYSYPIGYYADYNITRNLFYGLYSLQGGEDLELLCKLAALARGEDIPEK